MSDEIKEAPPAQQAPAPKQKAKPEKVKLRLTGAGSCSYEGLILRKNEIVELDAPRAEQFLKSGLFEKL